MSFPGPNPLDALSPFERSLVDTHWDDTIDGIRTDGEDVASFLEPFLHTITLQQE